MTTHISKAQKSALRAKAVFQEQDGNAEAFQFTDNRPEAAVQRKLQQIPYPIHSEPVGNQTSSSEKPIQRMYKFGSAKWAQHQKEVAKGGDQLALFGAQAAGQPKATANVDLYDVPDISKRPDGTVLAESFENIEKQSWAVAKKAGSAPRTEIVGEAVTMTVMMRKKGYQFALPVAPGHGTGVDQVWFKGASPTTASQWLIVEAKGPGAKLSTSFDGEVQMSQAWVESRILSMTKSKDPGKSAIAKLIHTALLSGLVPVRGLVITAKTAGNFGFSQSKYKNYT